MRTGPILVFEDAVCIQANVRVQWLQQIRASRDAVRRAVWTLAMHGRGVTAKSVLGGLQLPVRGPGLTLTGRIRARLGLGVRLGLE